MTSKASHPTAEGISRLAVVKTNPKRAKTRKAPDGRTRKGQTRKLRADPGVKAMPLYPGGKAFSFRVAGLGMLNLSELRAVWVEQTGGRKNIFKFLCSPDGMDAIREALGLEIDAPRGAGISPLPGPDLTPAERRALRRAEADQLIAAAIERGLLDLANGRDTWACFVITEAFAMWLDRSFGRQLVAFWREALEKKVRQRARRHALTAEQRALRESRVEKLRTLTDVLKAKGVSGQTYLRVTSKITYLLTGHLPDHWKAILGEHWQDAALPDFQKAMAVVNQLLARCFEKVDLSVVTEGEARHFNQAAAAEMPLILETLELAGLPRIPIPPDALPPGGDQPVLTASVVEVVA